MEYSNYVASGAQSKCYMVVKRNVNLNINIPQIVAIKMTRYKYIDRLCNDDDDDIYIEENKLLHMYGGIIIKYM